MTGCRGFALALTGAPAPHIQTAGLYPTCASLLQLPGSYLSVFSTFVKYLKIRISQIKALFQTREWENSKKRPRWQGTSDLFCKHDLVITPVLPRTPGSHSVREHPMPALPLGTHLLLEKPRSVVQTSAAEKPSTPTRVGSAPRRVAGSQGARCAHGGGGTSGCLSVLSEVACSLAPGRAVEPRLLLRRALPGGSAPSSSERASGAGGAICNRADATTAPYSRGAGAGGQVTATHPALPSRVVPAREEPPGAL